MTPRKISSVLERTTIKSSRPGLPDYPMIRTPSGWQHDGRLCERGLFNPDVPCRHVKEAERTMTQDTSRALVTSSVGEAMALEAFASDTMRDVTALQNAAIDVIDKYCYSFNQGDGQVTDLSIKGVQAIAREMAKKGEIIKPVDIQVVAEDDDEIRVICTASREIIRVIDGQVVRIELDRTTRGKRQPKMQEVNVWEGSGQNRRKIGTRLAPDKFWYEKAISKAVRNAMAPLMGGEARAQVIDLWRQAQVALGKDTRYLPAPRPNALQLQAGAAPAKPSAQRSQQQPAKPAAAPTQAEEDAMPATQALRQQITKKFNEAKTSLSGADQQRFLTDFYAAFPACKPLQGALGGLVLAKVGSIGEGKGIMKWINGRLGLEAPPDDSQGLEGALTDPQAREDTKVAVMEGCQHPDDQIVAHPSDENLLVCGACGETFELDPDGQDA